MKIKLIDFGVPEHQRPYRPHGNDAGADVYLPYDCTLQPGEIAKIPLGFGLEIPDGYGELSATSFMDQIADMSRTLVKEHTTPEERFADLFPSSRGTAHEAVGVCPRCGAPVYEGKKGFFCDNRECSFALWKDNRFFSSKKKSITKSVAAALLKEGRISMSGLYSEKTGKTYDAEVILDDTGGKYVNFKLEFPVKKGRRK